MISRDQFFDKILPTCLVAFLVSTHLMVALGTELAHDEAYYWLYSKNLDWGYFDHPPMVGWLIKISSWMGGEIGVRFSFIVGLLVSGAMLQSIVPRENKWIIWLGLNVFPLLSFSGIFALPDGALLITSGIWIYALKYSLEKENLKGALFVAVATACLFYSKYHGIFYLLATILVTPRLLAQRYFWLSALIALAMYWPHVNWQWSHDFSTFRYHFLERPRIGIGFKQPLEFLLVNFVLAGVFIAPFMWREFFKKPAIGSFERSLKSMTLLILVFFLYSTLSKKMEANWTVAAGLSLLVFVALKPNNFRRNKAFLFSAGLSLCLVLVAKIGLVSPGLLPIKRIHEFHGWKEWAVKLESDTKGCLLAANQYQYASKLSYYLGKDVTALNVSSRKNQFDYWDRSYLEGQSICWIADQSLMPGETVLTPTGQKLTLVKAVPFELIMSYKGI